MCRSVILCMLLFLRGGCKIKVVICFLIFATLLICIQPRPIELGTGKQTHTQRTWASQELYEGEAC